MVQFRYRAVNQDGKVISGTHQCQSVRELEFLLEKLNLELISSHKIKPLFGIMRKRKIGRRDLVNFCFYLEQLLASGIAIIDALGDLQKSLAPSYLSEVIGVIESEIKEGKNFSETLKMFPEIFSRSFVSLILAGEKSGELVHVLRNLTESLRWQDELIAQTKKALMLPAFIATVVFAVVFFLMIYLVPQMVAFITSMGQALPMHTQVLIGVSSFFVQFWYLILVTPFMVLILFQQLNHRNQRFRLLFDRYKLKLWLLGSILEKIILARFVNYLALLYNAGIPILESLEITESVVDNKAVELELQNTRLMISQGESIGAAFEQGQLFPRLVLSMIKIGEKTGDLGGSLRNVSYFYKRDVDDAIDNIQRLIEPIMTVILGFIIGWVMLSVLGPIYDLIANIKL